MELKAKNVTELLYRLQIIEFDEHFERLKNSSDARIWVSALTLCPLKWKYMQLYPELARGAQFRGSFILGKLAHAELERIMMLYAPVLGYRGVDVEVEVEKPVEVDGKKIILSGRIDAVAYKDDGVIVYEIKTGRSDLNIPHEHHILQLRIYMNMVGAHKGILIYLTPDRIAEYVVDKPLVEEELQNLVKEFLEFKGPKYDWECQYCPYSVLCPQKKTQNITRG